MTTKEKTGLLLSKVEQAFSSEASVQYKSTRIPYIMVDNFPKLGLFTSLRFLEWVAENPEGVISLPTGKTPEFFIKWTQYILNNWNDKKVEAIRDRYGIKDLKKPELKGLQFVQIDEFYPISSQQHNSFNYYVTNLYLKGFGLDINKALLINSDNIPLPDGKHFSEVFPDSHVDLSLRYRECHTQVERMQQKAIFMIDDWCSEYEQKIRQKGGIGFFLGGIGPDGHIAFNTRGSDIYSTTRLTATNFETQAVAASDLGGIEVSSNRLVITIGLDSIVYNPEAVAIIIAAGEAKAKMVRDSLQTPITNVYPATVLQKLKNSRFYITEGAGSRLDDSIDHFFAAGEWNQEKTDRAVVGLCKKLFKYGNRLTLDELKADNRARLIPNLSEDTVPTVIESILEKFKRGMRVEENQVFLHTGPHHDDILLGILPVIAEHARNKTNKFHFSVMTSGFNAVTNKFVIEALIDTKRFMDQGLIQMINYPDFFEVGYKLKRDKDVYHYLTKVAAGEPDQLRRGLCHRVVRAVTEIYGVKSISHLRDTINDILSILKKSYDGEKNMPPIQKLKGMIREFEEELVWAHFGTQVKDVDHMRLGFYKGDIFTEQPEKHRDVMPILDLYRRVNPTVISLAFDPEGSGPDTHYKVLQATADALREWKKEKDLSDLRIWGYRNVWYRFNPAEANVIFPVSLNDMACEDQVFTNCYLSQVDASFPSFELNGKFSSLAQRIWVEQLKDIQLLMGKDFFYQNEDARIRASHGLIFFKEMGVDEFLSHARELEKTTEGDIKLQ
jgi:glucosamine-6-phosphate deaminase